MAEAINFVVTKVGLNALADANEKGIKLTLSNVGLGSGQYTPKNSRTAMAAKFTDNGISAGGIESESFVLRFTLIMSYSQEKAVSEIGLYTSTGVLFAVASKPSGSFFTLYPSIDYVANMGLKLNATQDISKIAFVLDGQGGIATALMNDHVAHEDPHPIYKQYAAQQIKSHVAEADPHKQYALKTFVATEIKRLDSKINALMGITDFLFPPMLQAGYGSTAKVLANRKNGAHYSWLNPSIIFHLCPEGTHESWAIKREENSFSGAVVERLGAYAGRVNYLILDKERTLLNQGFISKTNQLANEIKSGTFEAGEKLEIFKESWETLAYNSNDLVILVTPEGENKSWTITRTADKITLNVLNRLSNATSPNFVGRVNWSIFKANKTAAKPDKYPFNLTTGLSSATNGAFTIPAPTGHDLTDPNYFPIIAPEGKHEGWTITRTKQGFNVNVFVDNGSGRLAYSGKVNWALFMINKQSKRTILKPGSHSYSFKAGFEYRITLVGGGGAGGNAIRYHSGATALASDDGGNSTLTISGFKVVANGGGGGVRGCWNNGSSYRDGTNGKGGKFAYSNTFAGITALRAEYETGEAGTMAAYDVGAGGGALYGEEHAKGDGGKGHYGSGSRKLGFGGSGGGAGSGIVSFTVLQAATGQIVVGKGGKYYDDPTEYYQKSWHFGYGAIGQDGVVIIDEIEI